MLNNPNWQKPTPEVFSTAGLVAWLEKQPSDVEYAYSSSNNCLICQYLRASGLKGVYVTETEMMWGNWFKEPRAIPPIWNKIARCNDGFNTFNTFGEAKRRAKRLLAEA